MMKPTYSYFPGYHVFFIFLQIILTSENLMVTTPTGHVVARVGGQAELSCQVTPPRSVAYMDVRWFREDKSKLVYQYRGGHGVDGEAAPEYVKRTEFVSEAIGKGKVALRIHNISIFDDGPYQCSFNDSGFSDVAFMNLSVAAFGLKMQINVQSFGYDGIILECSSVGWFPRPQMEWKDNNGNVVPYSSISYSQNEDRFFFMKITLLLRNQSQESITCCVHNPLTGEEKQTSLIIANALFDENYIKYLIFIFLGISICLCLFYLLILYLMNSAFSITIISHYLQLRNRVFISDPLYSLYNSWMENMAVVIVFIVSLQTMVRPVQLQRELTDGGERDKGRDLPSKCMFRSKSEE
ncbi:selection and upkeep of intraepithelial T-cells protein 8-like [Grammomys surdaster]|uniref:selection and upkeep of intraepithelial T-cells protein 8-like n=1 Tax=Grammomys surdaster TaxID=491861 RepID=UPI0010A0972D|nr:selection and upkeep of intraepithelial T-cells protein 8-like [Grammomys surdaster]